MPKYTNAEMIASRFSGGHSVGLSERFQASRVGIPASLWQWAIQQVFGTQLYFFTTYCWISAYVAISVLLLVMQWTSEKDRSWSPFRIVFRGRYNPDHRASMDGGKWPQSRTTVQHAQQRCQPLKTRPISHVVNNEVRQCATRLLAIFLSRRI